MSDLQTMLRDVADRADVTALPDAASVRRRGERRTRRTAVAWASALVVAAAIVGAVTTRSPDPAPRPAPPASASETPGPQAPATTRVLIGKGIGLRAVAVHDGRFVLVGDSSVADTPLPIWWSDDTENWTRAATGPEFPNVWDVTAWSGGFAAVAPQGLQASTAWWSADGDHWERATVPDDFHVFSVFSTAEGLVACGDTLMFSSADGRTWADAPRGDRVWCGPDAQEAHWAATSDGVKVQVDPYTGQADQVLVSRP